MYSRILNHVRKELLPDIANEMRSGDDDMSGVSIQRPSDFSLMMTKNLARTTKTRMMMMTTKHIQRSWPAIQIFVHSFLRAKNIAGFYVSLSRWATWTETTSFAVSPELSLLDRAGLVPTDR